MTTAQPRPGTGPGIDCRNRIGINGDQSCPELRGVVHCRNCPVFSEAARAFFDRPAPAGYLDEWTALLSHPDEPARGDDVSVLMFRLGNEWLALRTRCVVEVTTPRPVHRIPHRSGATLVGMVNLRGQLQLQVSLHGLLGLDESTDPPHAPGGGARDPSRLVVIRQAGQTWVFVAGEVRGVTRFGRDDLRPVPSNLANPAYSYSQSVIFWEGHSVGFLDDQRLFAALRGGGHE